MTAMIPWLAAGMGLLISSDHLRLWGNLAGRIGPSFWIVALVAASVYALSGYSYRRLAHLTADSGGYLAGLRLKGGTGAVALALASRLVLSTGISTGILVTAGFVFNETFVYWFPNFIFAFLCLTCVALVLLWDYAAAEKVQGILLAITVLGLSILVVSGWWQPTAGPAPDSRPSSGVDLRVAIAGLLLFVGFDLGIHRSDGAPDADSSTRTMPAVLGLTVLLMSLWGAVSLEHVPAQRLADTYIPYTLVARNISGQTGRVLMGIVVIAGTGCAVIALFSATARMVGSLARMKLLPRFCRGSDRRNVPATVLLTTTVAVMMAIGFAGKPDLEVFIRAGFLLWLVHTALVHLLACVTHTANPFDGTEIAPRPAAWFCIPAALLLGAGAVYLWATDAERMLLLIYLIAAWSTVALVLLMVHLTNQQAVPEPP